MQVLDNNEAFIERVAKGSPELEKILKNIVENKKTKRDRKKEIAAITKEILESNAVTLDDESEVTFGELLTGKAVANTLGKEDLGVKDLQDIQKVIGEQGPEDRGVVINLITGGQDLGD